MTLLTAATRWEAHPLAKGLGLGLAADGRYEGSVGGRRIVMVKTGVGASKTREALERGFTAGDFGLAVSTGLCGAMQDGVRSGDIVADANGVEMRYVEPLKETARALGVPVHFGKLLHTNVVLKPEAKRRLGTEHRAIACDMETAAVRRWAFEKLPVIGVRAVLDELDDDLPEDSPDEESPIAMARYVLARPRQAPRLVRTGLRCARAMRTLAQFLKTYLETI